MLITSSAAISAADPIANANATVRAGANLRITVLRDGLMRLQAQDPEMAAFEFDDRQTLQVVNRRLPVPAFNWTNHSGSSVLTAWTEAMSVTITAAGKYSVTCNGREEYSWSEGHDPSSDFETFVNPSGLYVMDDASTARLRDSASPIPWFDYESHPWAEPTIPPGQSDYYIFCYSERSYASALSLLSDVTGPPPLMPRAAYGVWWCQCCPAYSAASFNEEVTERIALPLLIHAGEHATFSLLIHTA